MTQGKGKYHQKLRQATKRKIVKFLDEYHCAKPTEIANQIKVDKKSVKVALEELVQTGRIIKKSLVNLDNRSKKIPYYCSPKDPRMYRILADNKSSQSFGHGYFVGIMEDVPLDAQFEHKINILVKERDKLRRKLNVLVKKINHDRPWITNPYKIKEPLLARHILLLQLKKIILEQLNKKLTSFQTLQSETILERHFCQGRSKVLESRLRKSITRIDDLYYTFVEANSKEMFSGLSKVFVVDKLLEMTIGQFAKKFGLSQKTVSKIKMELYNESGTINKNALDIIFRKYSYREHRLGHYLGSRLERKRHDNESNLSQ